MFILTSAPKEFATVLKKCTLDFLRCKH